MSAGTRSTAATGDKPQGGLALPIAGALLALLLIVVGVVLAWQRDEKLPTVYGRRRGGEGSRSVNGTAVLADLFRQKGFRTTTATRFSPRFDKYDIIVWVPDDFEPPDEDHRRYLETWLKERGSTLVYVGPDYDAAVDYWNRIVPEAPPEFAEEALRRQASARAAWESQRSKMPVHEYARWFTAQRDKKHLPVEGLSGPWAEGIDAKQVNIHVEGRLALPDYGDAQNLVDPNPPTGVEPLLSAGEVPLVFRLTNETKTGSTSEAQAELAEVVNAEVTYEAKTEGTNIVEPEDESWNGGQIIVVNNGSFLLNYPLVNHEHRKLAAKLIDECGDDTDQRVLFIESGATGPRSERPKIVTKESSGGMPTALELLKVWPLNVILLHVAMLGLVLCLARSPIFGRPRELPADSPSDFGKHIAALGKLLAQSKDRNYAHARVMQYRQLVDHRSKRKKK